MKPLWDRIHAHPLGCVVLAAFLTGCLLPGLGRLEVDTSSEGLFDPADPAHDFYKQTRETFGDDTLEFILIEADSIFRPDILNAVQRLTEAALEIDGVSRVVSLSNVNNLRGRDGVLNTDRLLPVVPEDPARLEQIREDALSNPILVGEVVSHDGKMAAIHLFIESRPEEKGWSERIVRDVESLLEPERERLGTGVEIYQVGSPFVKEEIGASILRDMRSLGPVTLLVMLLLIAWFFRSWIAAFIPVVTALMSIGGTLGMMGYAGMAMNPMNTILPTLLLVIGSTEDIHMISEYAQGLAQGQERRRAVRSMLGKTGQAILMTSATTLAGFAILLTNRTPLLYEFGLAATFGIAFNFLLTLLLVPSLLHFLPVPPAWNRPPERGVFQIGPALIRLCDHPRLVVTLFAAVVVLSAIGATRIEVNTAYASFFRDDSAVQQRYQAMSNHLPGGSVLLAVLDTGKPEGLYDPAILQSVDQFGDYLRAQSDKTLGYTDYLRLMNREMHDGDPRYDQVPDSRGLIAQYTLLLDSDQLDRFLDFDRSSTLYFIRAVMGGSKGFNAFVQEAEAYARDHLDERVTLTFTGEDALVAKASDRVALELVANLFVMALVIVAVISISMRSLRIGLIAMVPNVFPLLAVFMVMGWFAIPLSTATFPVTVVALGIAVDDTVHMLVRYQQKRRQMGALRETVVQTLREEIRPVLTTSLALTAGFLVLLLADFASVAQFGLLTAVSVAAALAADLFITPLLLRFLPETA